MSVYVLRLRGERYYVGISDEVEARIEAHFAGKGAEWTRLYKAEEVVETLDDCDEFDELAMTLRYMKKHGVSNVRGSVFSKVSIGPETTEIIRFLMADNDNRCYICGDHEHYAKQCPRAKRSRRRR